MNTSGPRTRPATTGVLEKLFWTPTVTLSGMAMGAMPGLSATMGVALLVPFTFAMDPTSGLVLLGATNRPEILDPALLRAGRFDRQVLVDRPDKKGRVQILQVHMRKAKLAPDVDAEMLGQLLSKLHLKTGQLAVFILEAERWIRPFQTHQQRTALFNFIEQIFCRKGFHVEASD